MSHCYALTQKGTPCRSYATILSKDEDSVIYDHTCHKHKEYFKNVKYHVQNLEFRSQRRKFMENALIEGLIRPSRDYISKLKVCKKNVYFYLLCSKYAEFDMSWNPGLTLLALKTLWKWSASIGPVSITEKDMYSIVQSNIVEGFYLIMYAYPHESIPEGKDYVWIKFFEKNSHQPWFEEFLHSDKHSRLIQETILKLDHGSILLKILESGRFLSWLNRKKEARYTVLKGLFKDVKEEILEVAWEPSRAIDWCFHESAKKRLAKN